MKEIIYTATIKRYKEHKSSVRIFKGAELTKTGSKYSLYRYRDSDYEMASKQETIDLAIERLKKKNLYDFIPEELDTKLKKEIITAEIDNEQTEEIQVIFFKIKYDENGNEYAEELFSKAIFPIISNKNTITKGKLLFQARNNQKEYDVFYEKVRIITNPKLLSVVFAIEKEDIEYATKNEIESINLLVNDKNKNKSIISKEISYDFTGGHLKFHVPKGKTSLETYIKLIKFFENENVYDNLELQDTNEKEKQEIISNSKLTNTMNNIEILLLKLNRINTEIKKEKEKEYLELLKDIDNPNGLSIKNTLSIISFETELEFLINNEKILSDGLLSFLEELINKYDTDKKTQIEIKDIDKINHLFIKDIKKYPLLQQRKVKSLLSLLYIYEINENKDNITIEDLENSYFTNNISFIKLCLNDLIESGIIENFIIDLEDNDPETTLETIKNIKFTDKNQKVMKYQQK